MRWFKLKEDKGVNVRRNSRKRDGESKIITTAMNDFQSHKLKVKEFLFLMAARHVPLSLECNDGFAVDDVKK